MLLNSLSFHLSVKLVTFFLSNLNESLAGSSTFGGRFFLFIKLNILCHSFLACRVSVEKSADLLFFPLVPSSYWVLHGSVCSFPLVRSSCPLSAGVLHALLCLKVYSWCIRGERCTPRPPTPPPSCSLLPLVLNTIFSEIFPLPRKKNSPSVIIFLKTWGKNKVCRKENKYPYHIVCMWGLSSCEEL